MIFKLIHINNYNYKPELGVISVWRG